MGLIGSGFPGRWNGGVFTGVALAPDGTALAPAYGFSSDLSVGLFRIGADRIGFTTAGVNRWEINAAGHFLPIANNVYDIGTGGLAPRNVRAAGTFLGGNGAIGAPIYSFINNITTGLFLPAAGSFIAVASGVTVYEASTSGLSFSMTTAASASGMTLRQVWIALQASGISLMYSSGATSYVLGQSSQSAVQT